MSADSKLRSFTVEDLNKYNKFAEIQRNRGKKIGQRLNELMEQEIKLTDPNFKDISAVRPKDAPDLVVPNPFVIPQNTNKKGALRNLSNCKGYSVIYL